MKDLTMCDSNEKQDRDALIKQQVRRKLNEECYDKAMSIGTFVPWKDETYLEPRYQRVVGTWMESNFVCDIELHDVFGYKSGLPDLSHFNVLFVLKEPTESIDNVIAATIDDLIDKKLFIGNGGAFYFINDESDFPIIKEMDRYVSGSTAVIGAPNNLDKEFQDTLCRIGDVTPEVFKEYLDQYNTVNSVMGETSLF